MNTFKHGEYLMWAIKGDRKYWFGPELVQVDEVWDKGMYVVRLANSEDTYLAFDNELTREGV